MCVVHTKGLEGGKLYNMLQRLLVGDGNLGGTVTPVRTMFPLWVPMICIRSQ